MRQPQWQADFLTKTLAERVAFARDARQQSEQYKEAASAVIKDVNHAAVTETFARHGVSHMIHGHTHRPAVHEISLPTGPAQRIVLGDWYTRGSVLRVTPEGSELVVLE